jgi:hypothetical protein
MSETNENKTALATQEEEMKKLGLTPRSERVKNGEKDSDSEEEEEDIEDENDADSEDEEDEDSDDDEENEDEDENEDDEDDEDEEESRSHKKKGVPYKVHNQLRSDLRKAIAKIDELTNAGSKKVEDVPDDLTKRVEDLAKEIGVENPDGLKKIMNLMNEVVEGKSKNFEQKLRELEEKFGKIEKDAPIEDGFEKEWRKFEKNIFSKDYPDASDEEIEEAQKLMQELSHTPGVGGRPYKDENGREVLDPYPLDYVLFKNKDKFADIMGGKKTYGLETSRTQRRNREQSGNENKPLPKNASMKDLREYEKRSARAMEGMDNLSEPVDDTI